MKTRLMIASGAVLLAAALSSFVYVNNGRNSMDDLFNANVEALARSENNIYTCETRITSGDRKTFFCGSCDWVEGSKPTWNSFTESCTK